MDISLQFFERIFFVGIIPKEIEVLMFFTIVKWKKRREEVRGSKYGFNFCSFPVAMSAKSCILVGWLVYETILQIWTR